MQRRTVRTAARSRIAGRAGRPHRSSIRTRISLALLAFSTLLGTGLVVAPVAFVA